MRTQSIRSHALHKIIFNQCHLVTYLHIDDTVNFAWERRTDFRKSTLKITTGQWSLTVVRTFVTAGKLCSTVTLTANMYM